jgi:hypothetical protein
MLFVSIIPLVIIILTFYQLGRKRADEKSERDRLNDVYLELVEKQRAYYKRVKEFQDVSKSTIDAARLMMMTIFTLFVGVSQERGASVQAESKGCSSIGRKL